jgi:hypothetical protein
VEDLEGVLYRNVHGLSHDICRIEDDPALIQHLTAKGTVAIGVSLDYVGSGRHSPRPSLIRRAGMEPTTDAVDHAPVTVNRKLNYS